MNATNLTRVKQAMRHVTTVDAATLLSEVISLESAEAVQLQLEDFLVDKGLAGFIHARLGTAD